MTDLSRGWHGQCHRCGTKTSTHIMSKFNRDLLCMGCADEEKRHPDYSRAVDADLEAIRNGNYNFPGIGWSGMPAPVGPGDGPANIFGD